MDICEIDLYSFNMENRHPWEQARFLFIKYLMKKHLSLKTENIIDIGSGDGYLLNQLSGNFAGINFIGVDPAYTPDNLEIITDKINTKNIIFAENIELIECEGINNSSTLFDVLEHIYDDVAFLKGLAVKPCFDDNSLFMITVPTYNYLFFEHDRKLKHFRRYNLSTLNRVIEQAGLRKIEDGYFFTSLLIPRIIQKIFIKYHKPNDSPLEWNKGLIITSIIKNILLCDALICRFIFLTLRIKIPGLSCYTICKKQ